MQKAFIFNHPPKSNIMIPVSTQETLRSTTSILLVEDDHDDQDFITEALLSLDNRLSIHIEPNGNKALTYLETCTDDALPQLLILDYNLPEIDGAEMLRLLMQNKRYHAIPKIVWSTSNAPQYKRRSLESGAVLYMIKPSTIAGIESMAREMLDQCHVAVSDK
jgi:two-component system, chemotaxis family, chemotaxis protein CheY